MKPLVMALVFVLSLNVFLLLFQTSIINIGGDADFYNYESNILSKADGGNMDLLNNTNIEDLPNAVEGESPDSDTSFTDIFKTARNWLFEDTPLSYVVGILNAPYIFLKMMQVPIEITYAIGSFWWLTTFFLLVAFILGRE